MGQTNSSRREPPHMPTPPTEHHMSTDFASYGPQSYQGAPSSRVRHDSESQRSSARKSLLNLVKPSNIRKRVNSVMSSPGDARRSWRNSRRWSKAPINSTPPYEEELSHPPSSSSPPVAGPSTVDKGKRPERCASDDDEDEDEYHEAVEELPALQSSPMLAADEASGASSSTPIPQYAEEHIERRPMTEPIPPGLREQTLDASTAVPPPNISTLASGAPAVPLPPRQFPPPGTLVIVQGVVHTTDISRPTQQQQQPHPPRTGSDGQDDPTRNRTRDRLSALLRPRPTSRPSSTILNDPDMANPTPSEVESPQSMSDESLPSSEQSAQTTLTTPVVDEASAATSEPRQPPSPETPPSPESRLPSISSSSIDVLGTLLSVAAAATAASLLTGSSEPILSSGLAPPPPSVALPPPPPVPRVFRDASANSRSERMRQAWSTIRDRLGLRPSAPPSETPTPTEGDGPIIAPSGNGTTPATPDARELMLAEMARAFNIGLGLNGLGGLPSNAGEDHGASSRNASEPEDREALGPIPVEGESSNQESRDDQPAPSRPNETAPSISMPPEGSFERFLVDLQLDLRVALTHVQDDVTGEGRRARQASDTQADQQADHPHASQSLNSGPTPPTPSRLHTPTLSDSTLHHIPTSALNTNQSLPTPQEAENSPDTEDPHTESMPHLIDAQDSDSERGEGEDEYDDDDFHSAVPGPSQGDDQHPLNHQGQNGTTTSGMGRIDASGRINWWRLYRFPQITPLAVDLAAGIRPASSNAASTGPDQPEGSFNSIRNLSPSAEGPPPAFMSEPTPMVLGGHPGNAPIYQDGPVHPSSIPPSASGAQPTATAPRPVVPVIIVGLQSVHPEWRAEMPLPPHAENENTDLPGELNNNNNDIRLGDDNIAFGRDGGVDMGDARGRLRPRGWQSRAADAIRNLRPGRRHGDVAPQVSQPFLAPNGSRTFLIYVIGGYYPPDHSIVTGGPNNFDSFEALLELADLLGQVKPSTVSKEDIEKSGLEVVKASLLQQYFAEDKITANCLDRCLVCLEEYQPEEDVRVMKCRHVFHKTCVDEWMQRGRNNCPACRSTGVFTDTRDAPVQTA